jgi:hypothetical protein
MAKPKRTDIKSSKIQLSQTVYGSVLKHHPKFECDNKKITQKHLPTSRTVAIAILITVLTRSVVRVVSMAVLPGGHNFGSVNDYGWRLVIHRGRLVVHGSWWWIVNRGRCVNTLCCHYGET